MPVKEIPVVEGAIVLHKEYGEGLIEKLTDEKAYVTFSGKLRIFLYPEAFEKRYLNLRQE